ncbi:methyltransferase [Citricoccus sp. I39-566]|uniref:DUF7059 domain-containing protein n=1 Tax=Citricoccus sp. I39-566 TaxID=3073268 RepID=UPI00286AD17F|nr:methyltransferase [Citricoccus sp. I39-566]WMY78298.1 methyltransferase [Citricoccus sp. I39-566]
MSEPNIPGRPSTPPFNHALIDPPPWGTGGDLIRRLAADLQALDYTAEGVGALLGSPATAALDREQAEPARRRVAQVMGDDGATASQRALAAAVSCWMLGDPVPVAALDEALPTLGSAGAAFLNLGWIRAGHLHPVVDLSPYATDDHGDLWVASDQTALQTRSTLPSWHVVGIGRASLTLAGNVIRRPVARALDLGTGCGVQTLHLLAHADHVTATDLSDRALEFTAFNLLLNAETLGLSGTDPQWAPDADPYEALYGPGGRVTLVSGDLLEPVAGRRFDLVVSNPPFVITPRAETSAPAGQPAGINTYRDGGRSGDSLLAELVARLPEHLEPGGTVQMLGNWEIHEAGESGEAGEGGRMAGAASPQLPGWDARPRGWVPAGTDAWFIQRDLLDPAGYAETWLQDSSEQLDPAGYARAYRGYLADFADRGVAAVGFGYVWLRRPVSPRPGRLRAEVLEAELQQPLGPAWADAVAHWDVIAGADGEAGPADPAGSTGPAGLDHLRALHVRVPGDVTEERHQRFGADHPEVILARQGGGFRRTAHLDTATAGFLSAADGEFTVGQLAGAVGGLLELDGAGETALLEAVAELLADGFLVLAPAVTGLESTGV